MEKVVYILGAGFSAPLGIPVMSNFIMKAKDIYFKNPSKYSHFQEIFDLLNKMSILKNYFKTDLYNIEEILSVLEMNDYLIGENNSGKFVAFLKDVIEEYTPIPTEENNLPGNWIDFIFGRGSTYCYGNFVAELFNLSIQRNTNDNSFSFKPIEKPATQYSVVSLNYDLVLENALNHLNENYDNLNDIRFNKNLKDIPNSIRLSKLHGCIELGNIVPPTWNKNASNQLITTWQAAQTQLKEANHIRILGYSLPLSDSYMKYMFKSSLLESPHLKSIDVITLDPTGEVKKRYDDFIDFNYYNFKDGDIRQYLDNLKLDRNTMNDFYKIDRLEQVHFNFMKY
ncbi:SIR2 family protein [Paenibacillus motobuensis]|uniref:SIR2-like domain-containing protein n=1 Tax=Paenibacillus motobuensis TaxID=295324 RepID=A0ABP3I194_9BACL